MTDPHADTRIDAALEALARPEPPGDHVGRVLARTRAAAVAKDGAPPSPFASPLRWALPIAASLLVAASVTWVARDPALPAILVDGAQTATDGSSADQADRSPALSGVEGASGPYQAWGALREIDQPVLPPEAYWAMDAFEEWRRLGRATEAAPAHRQPAAGNRHLTQRRSTRTTIAWAPEPWGLPPIDVEPIEPEPLAVAPLTDPSPIELPAITLEPIVIAPLNEQEKP